MAVGVLAQDRELQAALPLMEECLRHAVRRLRTRMLTRSGTDTAVRVVQTRLMASSELLEEPEVVRGAAWTGFYVERGAVSGFAVMEGPLLERLTARLFGDPESPSAEASATRAATDVELKVAGRMCEELFLALEAHWPVRPPPRLVPRPAAGNRNGIVDTAAGATVVAATLECGPEETPMGRLTLAIPAVMLRGLVGMVDVPVAPRGLSRRITNLERLMPVEVELVVELTRFQATLGTLRKLSIGDELNLSALSEVRALVNGCPAFAGEPGACDGQRSFRVSRRVLPAGVEA